MIIKRRGLRPRVQSQDSINAILGVLLLRVNFCVGQVVARVELLRGWTRITKIESARVIKGGKSNKPPLPLEEHLLGTTGIEAKILVYLVELRID